jgi:nitrogen fixation NifU-like protein
MIDDDLKDLYQEIILDHGRHPRNHRAIVGPTHEARGHNPLCGDNVQVQLTLKDDHIADIAFTGRGCAISQASASLMTEVMKGLSADDARQLVQSIQALMKGENPASPEVLAEAIERLMPLSGVAGFPMRVKCATLAWHTTRSALDGLPAVATEVQA